MTDDPIVFEAEYPDMGGPETVAAREQFLADVLRLASSPRLTDELMRRMLKETAEAESRSHTEEMEWTCSHGVGHPTQKGIAAGYGVHGCDRCCLEVEQ